MGHYMSKSVDDSGSTTGTMCYDTWAVRVRRQYDMAVRMVVEGYPPDEPLQWDETTHIISL